MKRGMIMCAVVYFFTVGPSAGRSGLADIYLGISAAQFAQITRNKGMTCELDQHRNDVMRCSYPAWQDITVLFAMALPDRPVLQVRVGRTGNLTNHEAAEILSKFYRVQPDYERDSDVGWTLSDGDELVLHTDLSEGGKRTYAITLRNQHLADENAEALQGKAVVASNFSANDLKVRRWNAMFNDDNKAVVVQNIGHGPVTISKLVVNERPECHPTIFMGFASEAKLPYTLQVGDKATFIGACEVVRAQFETDQGNFIYSFD